MTDKPNPDLPTSGSASQQEQSIAVIVEHNPVIVLLDEKKRVELFDHIEKELAEFQYDLTTTAGREAARKFASKITKTKTAADRAGLSLTEEARAKIKAINEARNAVKERLDELATRARQPLTDWEDAEKNRVEACEADIAAFTRAGVVGIDDTAEQVRERLADLEQQQIDPAKFQGMTEAAIKARNHSAELLKGALARIEQQEAERAELARLRAEAEQRAKEDAERAAREAKEREAREKAEAEEAAAQRRAEEERIAAERAEQERLRREAEAKARAEAEAAAAKEREEAAAKAAQERAQREAEEAARKEAEARERAHAEALAAERAEREAAERRALEAEQNRIAFERQRKEAEEAEAARRAKAEADQAHRTKCKREAKEAIMSCGVTEEQAQKIVVLILAGEVPRVSLDFAAEPKVKQEAATEQPALV